MIRRILGLVSIILAVVVAIVLFPTLIDYIQEVIDAGGGLWQQIKGAARYVVEYMFQPIVLLVLGFIALK